MPSTYDPRLRLELQATGENEDTWGEKNNNNISLLAEAIAGHTSINLAGSGTYTLSSSNAVSDEARQAFLTFTGVLTGARTVRIPTVSKIYYINRATTGNFDITVGMASGTSVTLPLTGLSIVASDGTNCWLMAPPTGAVHVSVSAPTSSTAALRITQSGVGPVIWAEDSGADGSPFVLNANGDLIVGTSVPYAIGSFPAPAIQTHRTGLGAGPMWTTWSNSFTGPIEVFAKSRGTAIGTQAAVQVGDILGRQYFAGDAGGTFQEGAWIGANVAANVSASIVPSNLQFATRNLAGTLATRMTLTSEGALTLGTASMPVPLGSAPLYAARAHGKMAYTEILRSQNIFSITNNGTGDYTVTFTNNMYDSDYTLLLWGFPYPGFTHAVSRLNVPYYSPAGFRVQWLGWNGTTYVNMDSPIWYFAVLD